MDNHKTIVWDWNGTLLDDTQLCISSINKMLTIRHLPSLDREKYIEIFTFPVINYYKKLGFNFNLESWNDVALEFIAYYFNELPSCKLALGAIEALTHFKENGFRQIIISAMQHDSLLESVQSLGISGFFDFIGGIGDHYAGGKIDNARMFFNSLGINSKDAIFIGDTLHDAEVADELGCKCILVSHGHQSRQRLACSQKMVINNLLELKI